MKCLELTVYQTLCEHDHSSNTEFFTVKGEIGEGGEWWHQQEEESQGEGGQRGEEDKQHRLSGREEGERGRNKRWASTKEEKKKTDGVVGESASRRNERHWERQTERERGEREKTLTTVLWARVCVCVCWWSADWNTRIGGRSHDGQGLHVGHHYSQLWW